MRQSIDTILKYAEIGKAVVKAMKKSGLLDSVPTQKPVAKEATSAYFVCKVCGQDIPESIRELHEEECEHARTGR